MLKKDTIGAIATAMSPSGIGIVRISGEDAFPIIDRIYQGKKGKVLSKEKSHTIHYGYIVDQGEIIDEVLVMLMRGPRSFTGEDTVEINCHGGTYVVQRILETVLLHGARAAEPGEFTKRAFLNGKMDLSQAEAVIDIIDSQNEYALKSSIGQLKGSIKTIITKCREEILHHTAFIETALDDPEHISVEGYSDTLLSSVETIQEELERLIASADNGRIMKEGIKTVIVGKPNAGKSSLLNVLLGEDRAIVTDIEGTTRDILEENIRFAGISLNIVDTAGIRSTKDVVEKIGVDKAIHQAKEADLIIYVVDASREMDENDEAIITMLQQRRAIVLLNKTDLNKLVTREDLEKRLSHPIIEISAKEKKGIVAFEETVKKMFYQGEICFNEQVYITSARHKMALVEASKSLARVKESIDMGMPEDFYSIDLMDAYETLGEITGETVGEDLINEIFSKFCMGK